MPRRRSGSSPSRRKGSSTSATAFAPLDDVMESDNERDETTLFAAASKAATASEELQEMEKLEKEREDQFQETERELLSVLEADGMSEHMRKRQLTRLFDRFRYEYTQISTRFRESLRLQRKIMDKCQEMKNELVLGAIKIKTAKQMQEEEMKNLLYYRDECEHAWKATRVCEERERDAMRIIDELKAEIDDLQAKVKALLGLERRTSGEPQHQPQQIPVGDGLEATQSLSPVRSPTKRLVVGTSNGPLGSPSSKGKANADKEPTPLLSFEQWKASTRVWSLATNDADHHHNHKAPTPSQAELQARARHTEIARCVSVPSLHPTPMERATTAAAAIGSPSRRHQQQPPPLPSPQRRAITSVGAKRLPTVTTTRINTPAPR